MSVLPETLLPDTASLADDGSLEIGGKRVLELAEQFGTPLFVYDEEHLRNRCREAVAAFPDAAAYATKAFLSISMAQLAHQEGMKLDVATGGEMYVAMRAGVPPVRMIFHGNNKSERELRRALGAPVGRLVIDCFEEIDRIDRLVTEGLNPPKVLIRINPGVEAHTHEFLRTGVTDSKFGFGVESGDAERAVELAMASRHMELVGIHAHIGSQVFVIDSFHKAIAVLAPFVIDHELPELSIGGGLGVAYVEGEHAPTITEWATAIREACATAGITAEIHVEPGRAIVAKAGVTLYSIGVIKHIPGVRTYVAVDGGMSDNPRPVLYGSGYEAFLPRSVQADRTMPVRIVGKHCESGDVLVAEAQLPADAAVGDIVATPVTGAYGHAMGSNYNMVLRPPVVFVRNGAMRMVVRRQNEEDLVSRDLFSY